MASPTPLNCGYPDNHFSIGGRISWVSEEKTITEETTVAGEIVRTDRTFHVVMLRCNDGGERTRQPKLRVFDEELAKRMAAMVGRPMCLGGHVHTYKLVRDDGRTRAGWALDVDGVLSESSFAASKGAHCASNTIMLAGRPKMSRGRAPRSNELKCTVEMCCERSDGHVDRPKVVAYGDRAYELLERRDADRPKLIAQVVTSSPKDSIIVMSLVFVGFTSD